MAKVIGKEFGVTQSATMVNASVTGILKPVLSDKALTAVCQEVAQSAGTLVSAKNRDAARESLSQMIAKTGFKLHSKYLDQILDSLENKTLRLRVIHPSDNGEQWERLLKDVNPKTRSILINALEPEKLLGILGEEDGYPPYLMCVLYEIEGFVWNVQAPSHCKLESKEQELNEFQIDELFTPIFQALLWHIDERGTAHVTGPEGGEYLCGEVLSSKVMKASKELPLRNGYKVKLF